MAIESNKTSGIEYLFLIVSLILAPAVMLYFALDYFEKQKNSRLLESARIQLMEPLNQIKYAKNIDTFWCATLNEELTRSSNPQEMAERIERLAQITGEQLKYVVWHKRVRVEHSNFLSPDEFKDWHDLIKNARIAHGSSDSLIRQQAENKIKKLLGPHYLAEHYNRSQSVVEPNFIRPDSAGRFPSVWLNDGKDAQKTSALVLFKPDITNRDPRLRILSNSWQHTGSSLLHININKLAELTGNNSVILKAACFDFITSGREISQFGNRLVGIVRISQTDFIANTLLVKGFTTHSGRNTLLTGLLTFFAMVMALRSKPDFLKPNNISIKLQLLTLLFICSGLPLLSLAIGALEHLKQQREHLIRSAYQACIEYIQEIDRRSSVEFSQIMQHSYRAVAEFKRLYKNRAAEDEIIERTTGLMHISKSEFRAVASTSNYLITHDGLYKDGIFNYYHKGKYRPAKIPIAIKLVNDIGSYYLSFLNRVQIDPERYTELELLTEMFYQKNLTEIAHELLLLTDNLAVMGWGSSVFPVFLNVIRVYDKQHADFFFLAGHDPNQISRAFVIRQQDNLRRNEFGLNVFLYDEYNVYPITDELRRNPELINIFGRIGTHPALEPQLCVHDKQTWIFAGFKGNLLSNFKIMAMYPMSRVDETIENERQFIVYSGLATLAILVSLTLLFAHSFTVPITHLQTAAEAVEKRDFAFKLPDLGSDEFGEMGRVFNKSIAELEELSIASIVQSRLMPVKTIESGRFNVFGRSVPMADLGGDYYDYFSINDDSFAVLLGDVAGHGVGASLIMAMAKTAIICCKPWHDQPLKILENLHRLICTTRSKTQRKIMTFQYLCFDKDSGIGKYANAGGCSPVLVCPESASTSEISLPGPVLGGFKNSKFSEIELKMQPGQALVLYTDGIIETKNPDGAEIGYERFNEWLLKHYSVDADAYYQAVYNEYLQWLAGGDAQDDLTLIMLVYPGHDKPGNA